MTQDREEFTEDNSSTDTARPQHNRTNTAKKKRPLGKRRRRRTGNINPHYIIWGVMGALLLFAIIRLVIWNIGTRSDYDPDQVTDEFDVEALDYIQPLDPALLEGRTDDGVTTVVALGNDPFSDERGKSGLAALIADGLDATVYDCAFPGSTIAMKNEEYQDSYPKDALSLYWVTAAFCNGNFDLMNHVTKLLDDKTASAAAAALQKVDFEKVDIITIMYDLQDYMNQRIAYDENNHKNLITYFGALNASIQLIQETYPHIRIVVLSHPYGTFTDNDGSVKDGDMDDLGHGTLTDYLNWEIEACRSNGVTFIDNYYGTITIGDTESLEDGFHLTSSGRKKVAQRLIDVLQPKKSEK